MLKKHLAGGVAKGALTEEQAEEKFNAWVEEKAKAIDAKKGKLSEADQKAKAEALAAEKAVNEARIAAAQPEEEVAEEETEATPSDDPKLSPEELEVQSALEKALEAAKKINNPKLVTQIGNTITFFTRSEIIKENVKEEDIRAKFLRTLRIPNNAV